MSEPTHCTKCGCKFDPTDKRFVDSARRHRDTPFCKGCVDHCRDNEIADHWCDIDRFFNDRA